MAFCEPASEVLGHHSHCILLVEMASGLHQPILKVRGLRSHFSIGGDFPGGSEDEESACNGEDPSWIPRLGRCPGEGNGYPLQYSCLENSMDRGAWRATVNGIAKSQTRLSLKYFQFSLFSIRGISKICSCFWTPLCRPEFQGRGMNRFQRRETREWTLRKCSVKLERLRFSQCCDVPQIHLSLFSPQLQHAVLCHIHLLWSRLTTLCWPVSVPQALQPTSLIFPLCSTSRPLSSVRHLSPLDRSQF